MNLIKDTALYSCSQVLPRIFYFLLLPVMARFLTAVDYGVLGQMGILSLVATAIVNLGFNMSLNKIYFEIESPRIRDGLIWSSFLALLLFNALLLALIFIFSAPLSQILLGDETFSDLILISFASVALSGLMVPFTTYLKLERKAFLIASLAVIEVLGAAGLALYFVIGQGMGAKGPLLAQLIALSVLLLLFFGIGLSRLSLKPYFGKEFWATLCLGLPYIFSFFGSFLIQTGTRFALVKTRGLEEGGIYSISQTFAKVLEIFVMGMMAAWMPLFAKLASDKEKSLAALKKVTGAFLLIATVPIMGAFLFAKPVLTLFLPENLASGWILVGPLTLSQGFFGLYALMQPLFVFEKRSLLQVLIEASSGLCGILAAFLLTPYFGIKGAAAAQITSCALLLLTAMFVLKVRLDKERVKKVALALLAICLPSFYQGDSPALQFLEAAIVFSLFLAFLWKESKSLTPLQEPL